MNGTNPVLFAALPSRVGGNIGCILSMNPTMRRITALFFLLLTSIQVSAATERMTARQDISAIRQTVDGFLREQAGGIGDAAVEVGRIDSRLKLPACTALQAFLPKGSKAWGRTTVGVRCTAPALWTIYVAATVKVSGSYVAATVPLAQGQQIGPADIAIVTGDLTALPAGVVTDSTQAVGRIAAKTIGIGEPLRIDALRSQQAVRQGQVVRLVSGGPGFRVSVEGLALTNAAEGQMARAKTPAGNVVSGVARVGGIMEVNY